MAHQQRQVTGIRSSRTSRELHLHKHCEQRLQARCESEHLRRRQENVQQCQVRLQARHKSERLRKQQVSFEQCQCRLQAMREWSQQMSMEASRLGALQLFIMPTLLQKPHPLLIYHNTVCVYYYNAC